MTGSSGIACILGRSRLPAFAAAMKSGGPAEIRVGSGEGRAERTGHGPDRQATQEGPAGPDQAHRPRRGRGRPPAVLVGRNPGRHPRRRRAGGGHGLLRHPDPRHRRAARSARGGVGDPARRLGRDLRLARAAARHHQRGAGFPAPPQRHRRHRGPPLLLAFRGRRAGDAARAPRQPRGRADGAGGLVDHPAGGEARLVRQHPHARAQDQGDPGGAGAGMEVLQERDPVDLPEPRLPRQRGDRVRGRLGALFRQVRGGGEPRRGGDARRAPARAVALRADRRPRAGAGAGEDDRRADGEAGLPHRGAGRRGTPASGRPLGGGGGAGRRLLRRLGDVERAGVPDPQDHRGRRGPDHLRPAGAAGGGGGDGRGLRHQAQVRVERAGGGRRDVAGRRGQGDDRRARLRRRRGAVQPRDPGAAADRVAVQALRLRRGAASGREPLRPRARRAALALYPGIGGVVAGELHPRAVPRRDHPDPGAGALDQHRHGAALRGDRARAGAGGGGGFRHERPDRRGAGAGARGLRGDAPRDDRGLCGLPGPGGAGRALRAERAPPQGRRRAPDARRPRSAGAGDRRAGGGRAASG